MGAKFHCGLPSHYLDATLPLPSYKGPRTVTMETLQAGTTDTLEAVFMKMLKVVRLVTMETLTAVTM